MTKLPEWNTYEGWQELSMQVERGEKSRKRDKNGKPLFHKDQVFYHAPHDGDFNDDWDYWHGQDISW